MAFVTNEPFTDQSNILNWGGMDNSQIQDSDEKDCQGQTL
jgi:hypothetical protein